MMDPKRQGEIALLLLEALLRRHGIMLSREMMREGTRVAKAVGITLDELKEFAEPMLQKFVSELFSKESKSQGGA